MSSYGRDMILLSSRQTPTHYVQEISCMQKATIPPMEPELITSKFGFVENAEVINSRAAMVSRGCTIHPGADVFTLV